MTAVRVRSAKQGISHEYESYIGYCRDFSGLLGGGCGGHEGVRLIMAYKKSNMGDDR